MKKSKPPRRPTGDYAVGNCRPPLETRFRPGQSGNPGGRPKKTPTIAETATKLLQEKIPVTENGEMRKIPSQEIILRSTRKKAMNGDLKAAEKLFRLAQSNAQPSADNADADVVLAEDEELFHAFKRDLALGEANSPVQPENIDVCDSGSLAPQESHSEPDAQGFAVATTSPDGPAGIQPEPPPTTSTSPNSPNAALGAGISSNRSLPSGPDIRNK